MSIFNIVVGIVIAWFIIKGFERLADLLDGRKDDDENEKPRPSPNIGDNRGMGNRLRF